MKSFDLSFSPRHEKIVRQLAALFAQENCPVYLVGGYVRNLLLGLPPADLDIASPLLPQQLIETARQSGIESVHLVNPTLGTVLLEIDGEKIEHTTFRKESYAPGGGHTPSQVWIGAPLEEDAQRRDFSVNALYLDLQKRQLLDPTKRGLEDIQRRRLRSARSSAEEMISDDALRLLRLVRFACQLDFSIEKELFCAARRYASQIQAISKERIAAELKKILLSDTAYTLKRTQPAARKAVVLMETMGILTQLIPEFDGYRTLGQCKYHKYNIFLHTANTVGLTPPDLVLRYAALFHDVGKVIVWRENGRMLGHDKLGAEIAARRMPLLGVDKRTTELVCRLVREHMYDLNGKARESRIRMKIQSMGYENFSRLILLREADFLGSGYEQKPVETAEKFRTIMEKMQQEGAPMQIRDLNVTGNDLMQYYGIQGRQVGEVLQALLHECLLHPAQNKKQNLLRLAGRYIRS